MLFGQRGQLGEQVVNPESLVIAPRFCFKLSQIIDDDDGRCSMLLLNCLHGFFPFLNDDLLFHHIFEVDDLGDVGVVIEALYVGEGCLLYTSPSPRTVLDLVCRLLLEKKNNKVEQQDDIIYSSRYIISPYE